MQILLANPACLGYLFCWRYFSLFLVILMTPIISEVTGPILIKFSRLGDDARSDIRFPIAQGTLLW